MPLLITIDAPYSEWLEDRAKEVGLEPDAYVEGLLKLAEKAIPEIVPLAIRGLIAKARGEGHVS